MTKIAHATLALDIPYGHADMTYDEEGEWGHTPWKRYAAIDGTI